MGLLSNNPEGGSQGMFTDINVTPLVDVMLVLLIIFMVTAPLMLNTIEVNLPKGDGAVLSEQTTPLTITIDAQEKISIGEQSFTLAELQAFLGDSPRIKNGEVININADEVVRQKALVSVMSAVYSAGSNKINILMKDF